MRLNRFTGAAAAAALMAGSVLAMSEAASAEPPTPSPAEQETGPASVVLPTGDRVTVMPNGTTGIEPAPGREDASFLTPSSPSGDIVVVPTDRVDDVESGAEDPRRYNVSELLRGGHTDAASVPESELDERDYAGLVPDDTPNADLAADDLRKFHVDLRDRSGGAPDGSWVLWAERDGTDFDMIEIDESGGGSVALAPGDYVIVTGFWNDATDTGRGETYLGMSPVTVTDEDVTSLLVDGAAASPVSVDVEQPDAEFLNATVAIEARHDDVNLGYGTFLGPQEDAFLLPEPDLPEFAQGFIYQPVLTAPQGAQDPYVYNLAFQDSDGYPADPAYEVADDELATVAADYRDLGTPLSGDTCDYGDIERQIGTGFCRLIDTAVPSQRTMYYTADPEITWDNGLQVGVLDENGDMVDGFVAAYEQSFEPGPTERVMPRGGLSSGTTSSYRVNDAGVEYFGASTPVGGGNDEELLLIGAIGDYELSRDGEVIAAAEGYDFYWNNAFTELPAGDKGRYTLKTDLTQSPSTTVFGTDVSSEWQFDSAPVADGEFGEMALPFVALESDDIEGGYADRRGCQEVTLELRANQYGPVVHAVDMTFEVSYDDGATWKEIDIDLDGDTAEAELRHPRGAEFVSIRTTATDDAGTEVTNTVIRSFGLK